jgi:hypothetical protein
MRTRKVARRIEGSRALRDALQLVLINYGTHYSSVATADKLSAPSYRLSATHISAVAENWWLKAELPSLKAGG